MTNQCSCQKCHTECNTCKHPEPQHKPTECFTCSKPLYDIITYYDICDLCFGVEINTKNKHIEGFILTIVDEHGNPVTIDQTLVDAARVELDKLLYQEDRARAYPDWGTQLDYIYHNGIDKWKTDIVDPIKAKYPKPS